MRLVAVLGAVALSMPVCLYAVEHNDTHQRTFPMSGTDRKLSIENINGSIVVSADSGNDVRVTVREYWKADTQAELEEGRRDVKLEMQQTGNSVRLFLDGPFKDRDRNRDRRHYQFRHDFEVQVPKDIELDLRTVNGSEVRAERTRGTFRVKNVNGKVEMLDVAGSGEVETINGRVNVRFVENPGKSTSFKTINGEIDVQFQPNLSAELRLKSFNGDAYTDFDFSSAGLATTVDRKDSPLRYRVDHNRVVRVGSGGVEHRFETLNGNIKITKYGK